MDRLQRLAALMAATVWAGPAIAPGPVRGQDTKPAPAATGPEQVEAERLLASKGLRRVDGFYVLPAEVEVRDRVDGLRRLVAENQAALGRKQLRSGIAVNFHTLSLDLQLQRLALDSLGASNLLPHSPLSGNPAILTPSESRTALFDEQLDLTERMLRNVYNANAGLQADIESDAAEALDRQARFAEGRAAIQAEAASIPGRYGPARNDAGVQAALATLGRAGGSAVALGPADDYEARLRFLSAAMDETRSLTTARDGQAPDYAIAALLADTSRRNLRMAMGRLEAMDKQAAAKPTAADPPVRAALVGEIEGLRARFVRSAGLLRQAYDALPPPPPVPPPTPSASASRVRALIERQHAELRASFVSGIEKALATDRVPLERDGEALWVQATINGVAGLRLRVDRPAGPVIVSVPFAATFGLRVDESAPTQTITAADGQRIEGRRAVLRSVQVGTATAAEVDVLVVSNGSIAPSLGWSFLGRFVVRLDSSAEPPTLALTVVDLTPIAPRPLPPGAPPPKRKR